MHKDQYQPEIDGLRSLAVFLVILFHSGVSPFPGGFIGVDVFFVISGYLITGIIINDVSRGNFSFLTFYKKRIARILPSLIFVILLVISFGFVFYDLNLFDKIGKQAFFAAFGMSNILFSEGVDYFHSGVEASPLVHTWSLGVEEQFYLVWPAVLVGFIWWAGEKRALWLILFLVTSSLVLSEIAISQDAFSSYFLPHYRAFELLIGAFFALLPRHVNLSCSFGTKHFLSISGMLIVLLSSFLMTSETPFPGKWALVPCLATALIILFSKGTVVGWILSRPFLVGVGLISYPLYLLHQPVISALLFLEFFKKNQSFQVLAVTTLICLPASYLVYRYIERPCRNVVRRNNLTGYLGAFGLVGMTGVVASAGLVIALTQGVPQRFKLLNPFSFEISEMQKPTFHERFQRGFDVDLNDHQSKILFFGDSLLQQYVAPIVKASGVVKGEVDIVSRGGCVLLKGVDFEDTFNGISCNDLRRKLYEIDKSYDYVFFSQNWSGYSKDILNSSCRIEKIGCGFDRWQVFIAETIRHWQSRGAKVFIIGGHLAVNWPQDLLPVMYANSERYHEALSELSVVNYDEALKMTESIDGFVNRVFDDITVLSPVDIWCRDGREACKLHDGTWSYFADSSHVGEASMPYSVSRLKETLMRIAPELID